MDETGLFVRCTANRSLFLPEDKGHGTKKDRTRYTPLLCGSWAGEKYKPLLIWKSTNLRALIGVNTYKMAITCRSQPKALIAGRTVRSGLARLARSLARAFENKPSCSFASEPSFLSSLARLEVAPRFPRRVLFSKG